MSPLQEWLKYVHTERTIRVINDIPTEVQLYKVAPRAYLEVSMYNIRLVQDSIVLGQLKLSDLTASKVTLEPRNYSWYCKDRIILKKEGDDYYAEIVCQYRWMSPVVYRYRL